MTRFQTNRLLVRDISEDDLNFLLQIYEKEENMKFISDGKYGWTKEQLTEKYEKYNKNYDLGFGVFTICLNDTNKIIGEAGLFDSFGDFKKIELGYILDTTYWGQGFGEEICNGLINYSFNNLGIEKLISRMYAENVASVRISEKCGMKRVKSGEAFNRQVYYEYEISKFATTGKQHRIIDKK
jgi:[ribosomal protein S5]-alanine N-acetyltransferase